jgi:hypothetical protein
MGSAATVMGAVNARTNPAQVAATMGAFARESARFDVAEEALSDAFYDLEDDEEADDVVAQVGRRGGWR